MENSSTTAGESYRILSAGIYTKVDHLPGAGDSISAPNPGSRKGMYVAGRILVLLTALMIMGYSFSWALDGMWNIATLTFIFGLILFIPFILFGRKIKELNKIKSSLQKKGLDAV